MVEGVVGIDYIFCWKGLWEYYVGRLRRPGGRRPPQTLYDVKLEMSRILENE